MRSHKDEEKTRLRLQVTDMLVLVKYVRKYRSSDSSRKGNLIDGEECGDSCCE